MLGRSSVWVFLLKVEVLKKLFGSVHSLVSWSVGETSSGRSHCGGVSVCRPLQQVVSGLRGSSPSGGRRLLAHRAVDRWECRTCHVMHDQPSKLASKGSLPVQTEFSMEIEIERGAYCQDLRFFAHTPPSASKRVLVG